MKEPNRPFSKAWGFCVRLLRGFHLPGIKKGIRGHLLPAARNKVPFRNEKLLYPVLDGLGKYRAGHATWSRNSGGPARAHMMMKAAGPEKLRNRKAVGIQSGPLYRSPAHKTIPSRDR